MEGNHKAFSLASEDSYITSIASLKDLLFGKEGSTASYDAH